MSARRPRTGRSIRFVIYHAAFRWTGAPGASQGGYEQFEKTGRVEWTSDLADIPGKFGVSNVYARSGPDLRPDHGGRATAVRAR